MINILFLFLSFLPIGEKTNQLLNPNTIIDNPLGLMEDNHISYNLKLYKNLNREGLEIYNTVNQISGFYKYKFFLISFDYNHLESHFKYNLEKIELYQDVKRDDLELNLGAQYYHFTIKGILNFNSDSNDFFSYGVYLDYFYNIYNVKYKIYFSKNKKTKKETIYFNNDNDKFIFPYSFNHNYETWGINLLVNKLTINLEKKIDNIETLKLEKKGFTIEDVSRIDELNLRAKLDYENYMFYFNYIEKIITANLKSELDDVKYGKLIFKDYYYYLYSWGLKFKQLKALDINFSYQAFDSYFYGNIEAWPFTQDSSSWVGGRFNFSSKLNYNRFLFKVKNKFEFFEGKLSVLPEVLYDKIIITPNTTTYEAGFIGFGKQNIKIYDERINFDLLHISSSFILKLYDFYFKLHISQIIPLSIPKTLGSNTSSVFKANNLEGFAFKFLIRYNF